MYFDTSLKTSRRRRWTGETEPVRTEIEELKRAIRALLFVTKLSRVDAHKDKAAGWGATLKCVSCPGCCGKKQEPPVQVSRDRKSELACLQELLKRLQDRYGNCAQALTEKDAADAASAATVSPDTPNVLQAMMQLRQVRTHHDTTILNSTKTKHHKFVDR